VAEFSFSLTPQAPLGGADISIGENQIVERAAPCLLSVGIPADRHDETSRALSKNWGLVMPSPTVSSAAGSKRAIWMAPDRILLALDRAPRKSTLESAYFADVTDAWAVLDIAGPQTLPAMERLVPLDVALMQEGGSASTLMHHLSVTLIRLAPDNFLLFFARSTALSSLHAVETAYRSVLPS